MQRFLRTATGIITVVTAAAWLIALALGQSESAAYVLGFIPARLSGLMLPFPWANAVPAILTPLTATLVHGSLMHIGFNLLFLVFCGIQVERVLGAAGFAVLYVVGAFAASAAQYFVSPLSIVPMIGASGAISAVIGAYALSFGRAKAVTRNFKLNRWINVAWLMVAWVLIQMAAGWLADTRGVLVATPAHVGGFIAGLLLQRPLLLWHYRKA